MVETLTDWMISYVKSKDANYKNIESFKQDNNSFTVIHASTSIGSGFKRQTVPKVVTYLAEEKLVSHSNIADTTIFTLNTKENVKYLIDNFDNFSKNETLKIIFVNKNINEIWQINPNRHLRVSKIMDSPIKLGIMSLFETIPEY